MNNADIYRVIIAGSQSFADYKRLSKKMDFLLSNIDEDICIIGGEARGASALGKQYATDRKYQYRGFPAKWDAYEKRAGYLRNAEMADNADALVAFWDGISKGTKHMIEIATAKGLAVRVIRFKPAP